MRLYWWLLIHQKEGFGWGIHEWNIKFSITVLLILVKDMLMILVASCIYFGNDICDWFRTICDKIWMIDNGGTNFICLSHNFLWSHDFFRKKKKKINPFAEWTFFFLLNIFPKVKCLLVRQELWEANSGFEDRGCTFTFNYNLFLYIGYHYYYITIF